MYRTINQLIVQILIVLDLRNTSQDNLHSLKYDAVKDEEIYFTLFDVEITRTFTMELYRYNPYLPYQTQRDKIVFYFDASVLNATFPDTKNHSGLNGER